MEYPVAQGIGVHIATEEDPVPFFLDHPAGDPGGRSVLHHHAIGGDDDPGFFEERLDGKIIQVSQDGEEVKAQDGSLGEEITAVILVDFGDALPQPREVEGNRRNLPLPHQLIKDAEHFLGLSQGKSGDENAASRGKNGSCLPGERFDFSLTVPGMIHRIIPIGALQDQGIDLPLREDRAGNQGLRLQRDISSIV
jgi:hypothetical protein